MPARLRAARSATPPRRSPAPAAAAGPAGRPHLTARGWHAITASGFMAVFAFAVGLEELFALAAALLAAQAACLGWLWHREARLVVSRRAHPALVEVGADVRAEVTVANPAGGAAPLAALTDGLSWLSPVEPEGRPECYEAALRVPRLGPGAVAEGTYRLDTSRRGLWELGPLSTAVQDPLGLFSRASVHGQLATVVVHPRTTRLVNLPVRARAQTAAVGSGAPANHGEEFHSLREYQPGDDLRRVHWRSSARLDRLLVRVEQPPRSLHVAVLLDLRPGTTAAAFEYRLEVAASIAQAVLASFAIMSLSTTSGELAGPGRGPHVRREVMEVLALAVPHDPGQELRRGVGGADLGIVVTGRPQQAASLRPGMGRLGRLVVVATDPQPSGALPADEPSGLSLAGLSPAGLSPSGLSPAAPSSRAVVLEAAGDLAGAWARAVAALGS